MEVCQASITPTSQYCAVNCVVYVAVHVAAAQLIAQFTSGLWDHMPAEVFHRYYVCPATITYWPYSSSFSTFTFIYCNCQLLIWGLNCGFHSHLFILVSEAKSIPKSYHISTQHCCYFHLPKNVRLPGTKLPNASC